MTATPFRSIFPRRLRYWSFHCSLNALPSFAIALFILQLWKNPAAIAAMLAAIATFILLYATLTSLRGPLSDDSHVLSRSLRLGAKIRAIISGVSLSMIFVPPLMMFTPDFWCGFLSVSALDAASRSFGTGRFSLTPSSSTPAGFISVYATTLLEGLILSFILLMISFFAVIFIQTRARLAFQNAARIPEPTETQVTSPPFPESRLATCGKTVHSPAPVRCGAPPHFISHVLENQKSRHHRPR